MKNNFKFIFVAVLIILSAINYTAQATNKIDSFETPSGILLGVDKYCKFERINEYYSDGKFSVKLSFNTNYPGVVRNFFLPVL